MNDIERNSGRGLTEAQVGVASLMIDSLQEAENPGAVFREFLAAARFLDGLGVVPKEKVLDQSGNVVEMQLIPIVDDIHKGTTTYATVTGKVFIARSVVENGEVVRAWLSDIPLADPDFAEVLHGGVSAMRHIIEPQMGLEVKTKPHPTAEI